MRIESGAARLARSGDVKTTAVSMRVRPITTAGGKNGAAQGPRGPAGVIFSTFGWSESGSGGFSSPLGFLTLHKGVSEAGGSRAIGAPGKASVSRSNHLNRAVDRIPRSLQSGGQRRRFFRAGRGEAEERSP